MAPARRRLKVPARKRAKAGIALLGGAFLIAGAGVGGNAFGPTPTEAAAPASQVRPNVVVVETDDQTVESMKVMSAVQKRIADQGVTFRNSFVNLSLCCPSRATFLTGQYAHNHGVLGNSARNGGFSTFQRLHAHDNLAVWLRAAGYRTALIGKYLNGYLSHPVVPAGWSEWDGGLGGAVYDYDLNENGRIVHYGTAPQDFKQDVLHREGASLHRRHRREPEAVFSVADLQRAAHQSARPESPAAQRLRRGGQAGASRRGRVRLGAAADPAQLQRSQRLRQAAGDPAPSATHRARDRRRGPQVSVRPRVAAVRG